MSELENKISSIKQSSPGGIDPIPEVKVYEKYTYQSGLLRSPFIPDEGGAAPTLSTMKLTFTETEIMTKERISDGF